jgi:hypothetical protein
MTLDRYADLFDDDLDYVASARSNAEASRGNHRAGNVESHTTTTPRRHRSGGRFIADHRSRSDALSLMV